MEKKILFLIFLLAFILRVYKLATFPVGFHIDEAKLAWNALSIIKTGKDDLGNKFPLYYNTFGDYRPTGIFYFTIPFIAIFGRNVFAVRFSSALFGTLTILPLYYFVKEFEKGKRKNSFSLTGVIASFALATSPWHIETSRASSEVAISAFFVTTSLYFLIRYIRTRKSNAAIFSAVSLLISTLLYHSIRFLSPIFILIILLYKRVELKDPIIRKVTLSILAFSLLLAFLFLLNPAAKGRLSQVSIAADVDTKYEIAQMAKEETGLHKNLILTMFHSPLSVYARRAISEYTNYFSANFLVGYTARPYRYITPGVGLLTFVEAFLFVLGCISIFKDRKSTLPLALLLVSPLPAAVTTEDSPNLHRAFFMIIFITIIEAYGILLITKNLHYAKQLLTIIFAFWLINFVFFLHMYYLHSNIHRPLLLNVNMDASSFRNIGAKDLSYKLEEVKKVYEKIIITNFPDDPYPWYAFFTGKDPQNFNKYAVLRKQGSWSYQNIIFSQSKCPSDSYFKSEKENNILVVDAGDCLDEVKIKDGRPMKIVDSIVRSDNSPVYVLLERN